MNQAVLVVGAGTMGAGIAQVTARAGLRTIMYDTQPEALGRARQQIERDLEHLEHKGKLSSSDRIATLERLDGSTTPEAAREAGWVIETASEHLAVKQAIFRDLEQRVASDAILATNTSTISVAAIASVLRHPERALGLHFFNPATVLPLVEVVVTEQTSTQTLELALGLVQRIAKTPIVTKDSPGFIVNRVARPFYGEALRLLEDGSDIRTVDRALRGAGFKMGAFELMDLIGLDINLAASKSVYEAFFQDPKYRPSVIQQRLVDAGRLGRKTGRGFYEYGDPR